MPRKIRPSRSSHAHLQNQPNIAQSNAPITRPLPEQSGASKSSGQQPLTRPRRETIKAMQLQKQFKEAEEAKAAEEKAQAWGTKFEEYFAPIPTLEKGLEQALEKAWEDLLYFEGKDEIIADAPPEKKELLEELAVKRLNRSIKNFDKAISDFDKGMVDVLKRIGSAFEEFDSLPDKGSLYDNDPYLKAYVEDVKAYLAECGEEKAYALHGAIRANTIRAISEHEQITGKCAASMNKMLEGDYSDSIRNDVGTIFAEFDAVSENFRTILSRGNEQLETCEKLLTDPYLKEKLKNGVEQYRNSIWANNSSLSMHIADHTERKLGLLVTLVQHDNREQQEDENLKEWYESMRSLIREYRSVCVVHCELVHEETKEFMNPGRLSQKALSIRVQAATEGQNRFEKIIRACGKRAAEYENLTQIVKDERFPLLLEEMAEKGNECIRNREYAVQMWTDKIQKLEQKRSIQASFSPPVSFSRLEQEKTLHQTKEGVVLGKINLKEGTLDAQDETGKTLSIYFKDKDSGNWVRDYGSESGSEFDTASSEQSNELAAIGEKTAACEKAENLIQKVRNIVETSAKFFQKAQTNVEASSDYDDKIDFLLRSFSNKARAISEVIAASVELSETQTVEPSGEDSSAFIESCLKFLRKEKSNLDVQLQQTQQDANIHFHKKRDPTESNFKFLWAQGQVKPIVKELSRRQSYNNALDWLDRYVISFTKGPQGEEYEPWVVHAHYNTPGPDASPVRVHMKRHAEKDWGTERHAYHSRPLSEDTFKLIEACVKPVQKEG